MTRLADIVEFLNTELQVEQFADDSHNGLQVENTGQVTSICCGVDASLEFFEEARQRGADLVVCHHGLSWGDSLKRITGLNFRRVGFLIRHDMALYACHLPLDAHARHGNNAGLARALGLAHLQPFGTYHGRMIGISGILPRPETFGTFARRVEGITGNTPVAMPFGKTKIRSVAMVVGGGSVGLEEAARLGFDVYLSGEPSLVARNLARDWGISAIFGGHYATESFGVQSLGRLLARKFKVKAQFIPMGIRQ